MFGSISTKIAHGTTLPSLGNQDLRQLQDVLIKEKEIVGRYVLPVEWHSRSFTLTFNIFLFSITLCYSTYSVQKVSRDLGAAADAMKMWGDAEGEDLNVGSLCTIILRYNRVDMSCIGYSWSYCDSNEPSHRRTESICWSWGHYES